MVNPNVFTATQLNWTIGLAVSAFTIAADYRWIHEQASGSPSDPQSPSRQPAPQNRGRSAADHGQLVFGRRR
jgi:hypothetical protein